VSRWHSLAHEVPIGRGRRISLFSSHSRPISIPKDVGKAQYGNGQKNDPGCEQPVYFRRHVHTRSNLTAPAGLSQISVVTGRGFDVEPNHNKRTKAAIANPGRYPYQETPIAARFLGSDRDQGRVFKMRWALFGWTSRMEFLCSSSNQKAPHNTKSEVFVGWLCASRFLFDFGMRRKRS